MIITLESINSLSETNITNDSGCAYLYYAIKNCYHIYLGKEVRLISFIDSILMLNSSKFYECVSSPCEDNTREV